MADNDDGMAVLFTYLPDGTTHTDVFRESDAAVGDTRDPLQRAHAMRAAVGDDLPGAIFAFGHNDKARDLCTVRRMRAMGFDDYTLADAARNRG